MSCIKMVNHKAMAKPVEHQCLLGDDDDDDVVIVVVCLVVVLVVVVVGSWSAPTKEASSRW